MSLICQLLYVLMDHTVHGSKLSLVLFPVSVMQYSYAANWANTVRLVQKSTTAQKNTVQQMLMQHEAKLSAVFALLRHSPKCCIFHTHKQRWCFRWYIIYCLVRFFEAIFSSAQTLVIKPSVCVINF